MPTDEELLGGKSPNDMETETPSPSALEEKDEDMDGITLNTKTRMLKNFSSLSLILLIDNLCINILQLIEILCF